MRIAFVGDVMLGRLVNEALAGADPAFPGGRHPAADPSGREPGQSMRATETAISATAGFPFWSSCSVMASCTRRLTSMAA
jgi:hypothetical protein